MRSTMSATSSAAPCAGRQRSSASQDRRRTSLADLPMVRVDPVLFEQVLFNLLDNAAKYAPAGLHDPPSTAGRTTASSSCRSADEGPGIPPADLERVSSTRSIASAKATRSGPAPVSGFRSAVASSRRWAGRLRRQSRTDRSAPFSPSACPIPRRCRQSWMILHDRCEP